MAHFNTVNVRLSDVMVAKRVLVELRGKLETHWPAAALCVKASLDKLEEAAEEVRRAGYDK